jgi:hypothetical protein
MERTNRKSWGLVAMACVFLLLGGCDPFNASLREGSAYPGGGTFCPKYQQPDGGSPPPMVCSGICTTLVFSRLMLPTDSTESERFAFELNGKKYNSLGGIMALLVSQAPTMDFQSNQDRAVSSGLTLNLLRIQPPFAGGTYKVKGQHQVAANQTCCANPAKLNECMAEAKKGCFNGQHSFSDEASLPPSQPFAGEVSGYKLKMTSPSASIRMNLLGTAIFELPLINVQIRGTLSKDGIADGTLSGAIPEMYLCNVVIPMIATTINNAYQDPKGDQKAKDLLKTLFDTNKDGTIIAAEVQNNGLIKTFLDGDVDSNGDGEKELSVGLGFRAVPATLSSP